MKKDLCTNKKCPNYGKYARLCGHYPLHEVKDNTINKVSDKRKEWDKVYNKNRKAFLKTHTECGAHLPECTKIATQVHHKRGKATYEYYTNPIYFFPVCFNCHRRIEENPNYAKAFGFSESRLSKTA